jgi:transposase
LATTADHFPDDQSALKVALIKARAKLSSAEALIKHMQLVIAKMKHELFGPRSERSQRLRDQLELQLKELAAAGCGHVRDDRHTCAGLRAAKTRRNLSAHLPHRRIVHPALACYRAEEAPNSGRSVRMSPRRWMWCGGSSRHRACTGEVQVLREDRAAGGPFHAISRGLAGPRLLADDPGRQIRHAGGMSFELADVASKARNKNSAMISPIAFAAVQKFDAIFVKLA